MIEMIRKLSTTIKAALAWIGKQTSFPSLDVRESHLTINNYGEED
jgi:hypothetical protein